jgi:glyoxylate/hydroxypyruvate reductase A
MATHILFYAPNSKLEPWQAEFACLLPEAQLRVWQAGDNAPADYAVVWKPPLEMLRQRPDLKAIFNLGAGVDAILQFGDALPAGVPIVRLDDAGMGIQMAEYVSYAVLRYFRRFDEFDLQARAGQWRSLKPHDRGTFTVGLLGLGVLGTRIAQALAAFDFPLNGWSRTPKNLPGVRCYCGRDGFDQFLRNTRVLVCVLPLTPETAGILNRATLEKLPQGAYLINIARGGHLVEQDLPALMQNGHIAAATLDVFHEEPLPPEHPFWQQPRITLTPHISALTLRDHTARQIAAKIRAMERGEPIAGVVDRARGY